MSEMLPLSVIVVTLQYDYGIRQHGYSYEYYNIYQPLTYLCRDVELFDLVSVFQEQGREVMNQILLDQVMKKRPDLVVFAPFKDELISQTVDEITKQTMTICYFFDDIWRVQYAREWARHVRFVTTPDFNGVAKFRDAGLNNTLHTPLGYNHRLYVRRDVPKRYAVSFVGKANARRRWVMSRLRKRGVKVAVWGAGWPSGFISQEQMIDIFNQSKINLNLSNSISWDMRYLLSSPKAIAHTLLTRKSRESLKGRHFELPGCGAFQLTHYVEGLEHCFDIGSEVAIYLDEDELIEKIDYYLRHDDEREQIAAHGHVRAVREHTYESRWHTLMARVGLI